MSPEQTLADSDTDLDILLSRVGVVPVPPTPASAKESHVDALAKSGNTTLESVANLLEADSLLNATALPILTERLIKMAQTTDDIEDLRKAVQAVRDGAMLFEKRKTTAASQAPLVLVFETRPPKEGTVIDVRSGAKMAKLREAAQSATDA